jgi:ribose transport system ATP-binding protein
MPEPAPRLEIEHVSKAFPGVQAVDDVSLTAYPGEILGLVGENGAGKTTLMNILTGALQPDSGRILLDSQPVRIDSPSQALELGVTIIHQELALIPQLTVGQNIYLGREPRSRWRAFVDWTTLYRDAHEEIDRLGLSIPVHAVAGDLPLAQQQLVEIAKALSYQSRLIVLDEPTSALTDRETEILFGLMRSLKAKGVTLIYISHRLEEVFAITDRISVMRDGQLVGIAPTADLTTEQVVKMMVGRELREFYPRTAQDGGDVLLRARGLRRGKRLNGIDLDLHSGEILGVAGLVGSGRTDLARALFGADPLDEGEIWLDGRKVAINSPQDAIDSGIGFVPEDRKSQGLFLGQSLRANVSVSSLDRFSKFGILNHRGIARLAEKMVEKLDLHTTGIDQRAGNLSGGNQQKAVIARWLSINPRVLILDEPTRGVDVGAKAEIYALMTDLAGQGVGILMISSELPEVLGVSDRILVMREGRIVAEFDREQANQDAIMKAATGQDSIERSPEPTSLATFKG